MKLSLTIIFGMFLISQTNAFSMHAYNTESCDSYLGTAAHLTISRSLFSPETFLNLDIPEINGQVQVIYKDLIAKEDSVEKTDLRIVLKSIVDSDVVKTAYDDGCFVGSESSFDRSVKVGKVSKAISKSLGIKRGQIL